jgi:hypothetical protein
MNIREIAEADLQESLEDTDGAGTSYILIDKDNQEYPVIGTFGDIGFLLNSETGLPVQGRTITAAYRISTLRQATEKTPEQGWRVRVIDLHGAEQTLHVTRYEPDRTIGIGRIKLAVK